MATPGTRACSGPQLQEAQGQAECTAAGAQRLEGSPLEAQRKLRGSVPRGAAEGAQSRTRAAWVCRDSEDWRGGLSLVLGAGAAGRGRYVPWASSSRSPIPSPRWR